MSDRKYGWCVNCKAVTVYVKDPSCRKCHHWTGRFEPEIKIVELQAEIERLWKVIQGVCSKIDCEQAQWEECRKDKCPLLEQKGGEE